MKNWKKSYFVLGAGKLSYYTDEMKYYPFFCPLMIVVHQPAPLMFVVHQSAPLMIVAHQPAPLMPHIAHQSAPFITAD